MSAFIVEDKTINAIVSYYQDNAETFITDKIREQGYSLDLPTEVERFARDLFKMNCQAVNTRYGEGQAKGFRSLVFNYKHIQVNRYQVLKCISCLLYQCSEGEVPKYPLYKLLEVLQADIALDIAKDTPQYNTAHWG